MKLYRSSKYTPDAKWFIPHTRKAMVCARVKSAREMYLQMVKSPKGEVIDILFSGAKTLEI